MRSKIIILLYLVIAVIAIICSRPYTYVINWDKAGYYVYLPAAFIHHDLKYLAFYEQVDNDYYPFGIDNRWCGIYQDAVTKGRFTKYTAGTSLMEMPAFLVADVWCGLTGTPKLYGYSPPYQLAVWLATLTWMLIGLGFLRGMLLRYFTDSVTALTMLFILFATNLLCYSVFEPGMSHAFSFSLFCLLFHVTDKWYAFGKAKHALLIGILLGIITITRPTNIIAIFLPLLYRTQVISTLREKLSFFHRNAFVILAAFGLFMGVLMIQLSYWHYTTNHWLIYSYRGESFDFFHPHIVDGLISYDKGWLIFTPFALAMIAGLCLMMAKRNKLSLAITSYFLINLYIVYSWSFWQYGGGFGARPLVESYALLAYPAATFFTWLSSMKSRLLRPAICALLCFFLALNLFQTYQFKQRILAPLWMNSSGYWHAFGQWQREE